MLAGRSESEMCAVIDRSILVASTFDREDLYDLNCTIYVCRVRRVMPWTALFTYVPRTNTVGDRHWRIQGGAGGAAAPPVRLNYLLNYCSVKHKSSLNLHYQSTCPLLSPLLDLILDPPLGI